MENEWNNYKIPRKRAADFFEFDDRQYQNVLSNPSYEVPQPTYRTSIKVPPRKRPHTASVPTETQTSASKTMRPDLPGPVPEAEDPPLPKELTILFQPSLCGLCDMRLSSNIVAKMHYGSKNHNKKIDKFLRERAEKMGVPVPVRPTVIVAPGEAKKKDMELNPRYYHCDVCDLTLTGKLHAESHYMGKNHHRVLMGKSHPAGRGYYDVNGKWVRIPNNPAIPTDTFGADFHRNDKKEVSSDATKDVPQYKCELCNVNCTCEQQIELHFVGQKHMKNLKKTGVKPEDFILPNEDMRIAELVELGLAQLSASMNTEFARYRTPSGTFYCAGCNMNLTSESHLRQHLQTKSHLKYAKK